MDKPTVGQSGEIAMKRRLRFNKWGLAEDPTWAHIVTSSGKLYDCIGFYRREFPTATMLRTRHFNGEPGPDIAAATVWILIRDLEVNI